MVVDQIGFWKTYQLLLKLMDEKENELKKRGVIK